MEQVVGRAHAPWHLSVVGALALLWNGFGAFDYLMKQTANAVYLAGYTDQQRAYFERFPSTLEGLWALGVWAGVAGAILLLLRNGLAPLAFALSVIGLLGATVYEFAVLNPAPEVMTRGMLAMTVVIWTVAVSLFYYARFVKRAGLLGI